MRLVRSMSTTPNSSMAILSSSEKSAGLSYPIQVPPMSTPSSLEKTRGSPYFVPTARPETMSEHQYWQHVISRLRLLYLHNWWDPDADDVISSLLKIATKLKYSLKDDCEDMRKEREEQFQELNELSVNILELNNRENSPTFDFDYALFIIMVIFAVIGVYTSVMWAWNQLFSRCVKMT